MQFLRDAHLWERQSVVWRNTRTFEGIFILCPTHNTSLSHLHTSTHLLSLSLGEMFSDLKDISRNGDILSQHNFLRKKNQSQPSNTMTMMPDPVNTLVSDMSNQTQFSDQVHMHTTLSHPSNTYPCMTPPETMETNDFYFQHQGTQPIQSYEASASYSAPPPPPPPPPSVPPLSAMSYPSAMCPPPQPPPPFSSESGWMTTETPTYPSSGWNQPMCQPTCTFPPPTSSYPPVMYDSVPHHNTGYTPSLNNTGFDPTNTTASATTLQGVHSVGQVTPLQHHTCVSTDNQLVESLVVSVALPSVPLVHDNVPLVNDNLSLDRTIATRTDTELVNLVIESSAPGVPKSLAITPMSDPIPIRQARPMPSNWTTGAKEQIWERILDSRGWLYKKLSWQRKVMIVLEESARFLYNDDEKFNFLAQMMISARDDRGDPQHFVCYQISDPSNPSTTTPDRQGLLYTEQFWFIALIINNVLAYLHDDEQVRLTDPGYTPTPAISDLLKQLIDHYRPSMPDCVDHVFPVSIDRPCFFTLAELVAGAAQHFEYIDTMSTCLINVKSMLKSHPAIFTAYKKKLNMVSVPHEWLPHRSFIKKYVKRITNILASTEIEEALYRQLYEELATMEQTMLTASDFSTRHILPPLSVLALKSGGRWEVTSSHIPSAETHEPMNDEQPDVTEQPPMSDHNSMDEREDNVDDVSEVDSARSSKKRHRSSVQGRATRSRSTKRARQSSKAKENRQDQTLHVTQTDGEMEGGADGDESRPTVGGKSPFKSKYAKPVDPSFPPDNSLPQKSPCKSKLSADRPLDKDPILREDNIPREDIVQGGDTPNGENDSLDRENNSSDRGKMAIETTTEVEVSSVKVPSPGRETQDSLHSIHHGESPSSEDDDSSTTDGLFADDPSLPPLPVSKSTMEPTSTHTSTNIPPTTAIIDASACDIYSYERTFASSSSDEDSDLDLHIPIPKRSTAAPPPVNRSQHLSPNPHAFSCSDTYSDHPRRHTSNETHYRPLHPTSHRTSSSSSYAYERQTRPDPTFDMHSSRGPRQGHGHAYAQERGPTKDYTHAHPPTRGQGRGRGRGRSRAENAKRN